MASDIDPGFEPGVTEQVASGSKRFSLVALAAVAVLTVGLVVVNPFAGKEEAPEGLLGFSVRTAAGSNAILADFTGEPLVINYFAAWCGPCRAELPSFEKVSTEAAADGVKFLGISRDIDETTWKSFIAETEVSYTTVFEGSGAGSFEALGATGMPTTVFLRSDGTVADVFSGLLPESTLREKVAALVAEDEGDE